MNHLSLRVEIVTGGLNQKLLVRLPRTSTHDSCVMAVYIDGGGYFKSAIFRHKHPLVDAAFGSGQRRCILQ